MIVVPVLLSAAIVLWWASEETTPAAALLMLYVMRMPFSVTSPMYEPLMCAIFAATLWLAWGTRSGLRDAGRKVSKFMLGFMLWVFICASALLAFKPLGASVLDVAFTFVVTLVPVAVFALHLLVTFTPTGKTAPNSAPVSA